MCHMARPSDRALQIAAMMMSAAPGATAAAATAAAVAAAPGSSNAPVLLKVMRPVKTRPCMVCNVVDDDQVNVVCTAEWPIRCAALGAAAAVEAAHDALPWGVRAWRAARRTTS